MNDALRAAVMAVATSLINMLILLGLLDWDIDQAAAVNLFVSNLTLLAAFVFKTGQERGPSL